MTPVRLRYLMLLAMAALSLQSLVPRALAYWRLHGVATAFANYALCMVGPTGPTLLSERPSEFWRLVRRRLVASAPEARPFAACAPALDGFGEGDARGRAHQARAEEFREYAAFRRSPDPTLSLGDLTITTALLDTLARAARPFIRAQYTELVRPSRHARATPHPIELPRPAEGRGLPAAILGHAAVRPAEGGYLLVAGSGANLAAYRSRDGGTTWIAADTDSPAVRSHSGECSTGQSSLAFKLGVHDDQLRVASWLNAELQTSFPLAPADSRLVAFACDQEAALAITRIEEQERPTFRICPHLGRCRDLPLPVDLRAQPRSSAVFSIARVRGVSVISVAADGVVRVVSSRDDGETWTPPVVAYDRAEHTGRERAQVTPTRLLGLDARVLLYAGAERSNVSYPVLMSDDFGASWQARRD